MVMNQSGLLYIHREASRCMITGELRSMSSPALREEVFPPSTSTRLLKKDRERERKGKNGPKKKEERQSICCVPLFRDLGGSLQASLWYQRHLAESSTYAMGSTDGLPWGRQREDEAREKQLCVPLNNDNMPLSFTLAAGQHCFAKRTPNSVEWWNHWSVLWSEKCFCYTVLTVSQ